MQTVYMMHQLYMWNNHFCFSSFQRTAKHWTLLSQKMKPFWM